jgi:hypothetical protein
MLIRFAIWAIGVAATALGTLAYAPATSALRFTFWIAWVAVCAATLYLLIRKRPLFPN